MPDDVNDSMESSPIETTTETTPVEVTTSAETENTGTKPQAHTVPKTRLDEVIAQRNEARDAVKSLEARLEALEGKAKADPAPKEQDDPAQDSPPDHLSQREKVRWYVERDASKFIERELGMTLKDAKALLATTQSTSKDYAERQWQAKCSTNNLDPSSREVQEMVAGLVKVGVSLDDAFSRASKVYGKRAADNGGSELLDVAEVETAGVSGVMTQERKVPATKQEAVEMAHRGVKAPHISSEEIIRRALERNRQRG